MCSVVAVEALSTDVLSLSSSSADEEPDGNVPSRAAAKDARRDAVSSASETVAQNREAQKREAKMDRDLVAIEKHIEERKRKKARGGDDGDDGGIDQNELF